MLEYGKNSRRDRFTDVDSTVRDGYVDESVPGSSPGSANGLRASSRWEYPTVPKEYHRSRVPYSSTLLARPQCQETIKSKEVRVLGTGSVVEYGIWVFGRVVDCA